MEALQLLIATLFAGVQVQSSVIQFNVNIKIDKSEKSKQKKSIWARRSSPLSALTRGNTGGGMIELSANLREISQWKEKAPLEALIHIHN